MAERNRWLIVVLYGAAMAWVESASVVYLRMLVDRVNPYQPNPLPRHDLLGTVELIREMATLIMLFAVGWLAGRDGRSRLGYTLIAWGVWDVLYYGFLYMMGGWPRSLFDWDILFLIPVPWWGPVLAPMSIALIMIAAGTLVTQFNVGKSVWPSRRAMASSFLGALIALYVFMENSISHLTTGKPLGTLLPERFGWSLFGIALLMLAAGIADLVRQIWSKNQDLQPAGLSVLRK